MNEAREVDNAPVVSCSNMAKLFEASEAPLDLVALLLDGGVVGDEYLAVSL